VRAVISAFYDSDVEAHTGTVSSAHGEHNSYSFWIAERSALSRAHNSCAIWIAERSALSRAHNCCAKCGAYCVTNGSAIRRAYRVTERSPFSGSQSGSFYCSHRIAKCWAIGCAQRSTNRQSVGCAYCVTNSGAVCGAHAIADRSAISSTHRVTNCTADPRTWWSNSDSYHSSNGHAHDRANRAAHGEAYLRPDDRTQCVTERSPVSCAHRVTDCNTIGRA
jgi:hypothetical protein